MYFFHNIITFVDIVVWLGVTCDSIAQRVTGLVLDGLNLSGSTQPLSRLAHLRHLSLNYNLLSSSSTLNLSTWPHLKHLYLSHNRFTGIFPVGISNLRGLRRLALSHNSFSGEIPLTELIRLPHLLTLRLESNSFTGPLNSVNSPSPSSSILDFNVSDNDLAGEIPRWVSRFPASSFAGNKDLCGQPLPYDCSNGTVESESTKPINKRMVPVYIGGDVAAVLGVIVTVTCLVFKRRRGGSGTQWDTWHHGTHCNGYDDVCKCNGEVEVGKEKEMVVFDGCKGFDKVGDLLKSSAELLGKGCVGTTFKILMDGGDDVVVVVKRVVRGTVTNF
jgi:hypothetical protein